MIAAQKIEHRLNGGSTSVGTTVEPWLNQRCNQTPNQTRTNTPTKREPDPQPNGNQTRTLHTPVSEAFSAVETSNRKVSFNGSGLTLRDDQADLVARIADAYREGVRSLVAQAPTGAGKTVIGSAIASRAVGKGNPVLVLAPRRELVTQMRDTLVATGLPAESVGVIMAGHHPTRDAPIQVASVDTLAARAMRRDLIRLPDARLVIVDEAHLSTAAVPSHLIAHYRAMGACVLGLTATPASANATPMGALYERLVSGPTLAELIRDGRLVAPSYYAPTTADVSAASIRGGDFTASSLSEMASQTALQGDVVKSWLKLANDRRTIVFAIDVAHARALAAQFRAAGVSVGVVTGADDKNEREAVLEALQDGHIQVVVNVFVLSYGFDCPPVDCVQLARPTRSTTLYLQMVGRGLRTHEGKSDCLVLDHGGTVEALGFAEDDREWVLGKPGQGKGAARDVVTRIREDRAITCRECHHQFAAEKTCPRCGTAPPLAERRYTMSEAELSRIASRDQARAKPSANRETKISFLSQLRAYAATKGYAAGWSVNKYREKFGAFPPDSYVREALPYPPSPETLSWIKSRQIAWAKSRKNPRSAGVSA